MCPPHLTNPVLESSELGRIQKGSNEGRTHCTTLPVLRDQPRGPKHTGTQKGVHILWKLAAGTIPTAFSCSPSASWRKDRVLLPVGDSLGSCSKYLNRLSKPEYRHLHNVDNHPPGIHDRLSSALGAMEDRDRHQVPCSLQGRWCDRDNTQNRTELIKVVLVFVISFFRYEAWTHPALDSPASS